MDLNKEYYKILAEDLTHNGFIYKIGENKDIHEFNTNECSAGGLYFTDYENLHEYIEFGTKMAKIKLYPDSQVSEEEKKYKTDKFEILEITDIPEEIYMNAVITNTDEYFLEFVLEELRDKEICLEAVKSYGYALMFVPKELRDKEICLEAVKSFGQALMFVPKELRDKEICLEAIKTICGV
jgi:hypothetical protein